MSNPNKEVILQAAQDWKEMLIQFGGSMLGNRSCWKPEVIADLRRRFEGNLLEDKGRTFLEKLHEQLTDAPQETIILAAEIIWVLYLFPSNIGRDKKVSNISIVWYWQSDPLNASQSMLDGVTLSGIGSGGPGFNNHFWREFLFALVLCDEMSRLSIDDRKGLLVNGDAFARWLDVLPFNSGRQFRHMILYLFFPTQFERISSRREKKKILDAFKLTASSSEMDSRLAVDIALRELRIQLSNGDKDKAFDFYDTEILKLWNKKDSDANADPQKLNVEIPAQVYDDIASGTQYYLVGASWDTGDKTDEFVEAGIWQNGYQDKYLDVVGNARKGDKIAIKASFRQKSRLPFDNKGHDVGIMRIKARGTITENPGDGRRLIVLWDDDFEGFDIYGYVWQPTISKINTNKWPHVIGWVFYNEKQPIKQLALSWWKDETTVVSETTVDNYDDVTVPLSFDYHYQPINRIYYGPPGTGKTFKLLASNGIERMSEYARKDRTEGRQCLEVVSFHQSYSYEDFIEGLRPVVLNNMVSYEVRDGVFKLLCERARDNPDMRFAIFIDEINRGNVGSIFGELITLIESDKRLQFTDNGEIDYSQPGTHVRLPVSGEDFGIPCNVDIYATMNTADRSLVRIDTALRRRFDFVECMPEPELLDGRIVAGVNLRKMLQTINDRIENMLDRDHTIGHAYFIKLESGDSIEPLAHVFRHKIIPLLEEYFFENWAKIEEVLGDNEKNPDARFIKKVGSDSSDEYRLLRYRKNPDALNNPAAYIGIYERN